ncbi:DUF4037 domain-containing protein [Allobranchiibius sp. CTAmp26]|uniref:DUF4037 domain-containing protein n=1 Tax=Allobranchiibius sp. CTAmp26 TaxID=2815214 RepID=UPI001AA0E007|nr:DUF4037 domain-containing protein [Allobranchiibius sp. CTAmp26]MBO1755460.1 DUF4037 domain-containing protein [Allobranchiibius sp. CTAmp26]
MDGLSLSRRYFEDVVRPVLHARWPRLPYAAARIGGGSEVVGRDDEMSRDHDWGLRLTLLVDAALVTAADRHLEAELPDVVLGYPVRFAMTSDPSIRHRVEVADLHDLLIGRLGFDPVRAPVGLLDWLSLSGQAALEVVGGEVFTDSVGDLGAARSALARYPDDLRQWLVACGWRRIGEELPLMGRCGLQGDELGSRVLAGRLVDAAMHLGFLLERRWAPYPKWRGAAFGELPRAAHAGPALLECLAATTWEGRESHLCRALAVLHDIGREAGLPGVEQPLVAFHDRPFRTVSADLVEALTMGIADRGILALPVRVGSVEQCTDDVLVLLSARRRRAMAAALYGL